MINNIKKRIDNIKFKKRNKTSKDKINLKEETKKYTCRKKRNNKFLFFKNKLIYKYIEKNNNYTITFLSIGIFLLISLIYVLFYSPYFIVKSIDIFRNDTISDINIAYKSINDFRYKNIFFTDKNKIIESIKSYQPNLNNVKIKKEFPDKISIIIESNKIAFSTTINEKQYLLLNNGVIVPGTNPEASKIEINSLINETPSSYSKLINQEEINKIIKLHNYLQNNLYIDDIISLNYLEKEKEIHLSIKGEEKIIFSLIEDIDNQISKLILLIKEKDIDFNEIIYIDLRIKDKIFICTKEEEYYCNRNYKNIYK